jgi:catechol 2,3-dioxygenase-like lactoylglutathione lyase family enzyme
MQPRLDHVGHDVSDYAASRAFYERALALTPTVEAKPRPSPADDPRTGNERRMPGLPGGL